MKAVMTDITKMRSELTMNRRKPFEGYNELARIQHQRARSDAMSHQSARHGTHRHTHAVKVPGPKASQQDGGDRVIGAEVGVRDQVEEEGHLAQGCFF
jgi:hypothetical protein